MGDSQPSNDGTGLTDGFLTQAVMTRVFYEKVPDM